MVKMAIIEDSDKDAENLNAAVQKFFLEKGEEYTVRRFRNSESIMENAHSFDILFFDIELSGQNGLEAAKEIRKSDEKVIIIFVTNMRQYVIHGYEVDALNYILKPLQYSSFSLTMERAMNILRRNSNSFIPVRKNDVVYQIRCEDILYIDVVRHDVVIHCIRDSYFFYGTLRHYEELLDRQGFAKCSASTLINLNHIKMIKDNEVYIGEDRLRISRLMKKGFLEALTVYWGENK